MNSRLRALIFFASSTLLYEVAPDNNGKLASRAASASDLCDLKRPGADALRLAEIDFWEMAKPSTCPASRWASSQITNSNGFESLDCATAMRSDD